MIDRFVSSRRQLFGNAGRGFAAGLFARLPVAAAPRTETNIYQRIGVQPVINCKGTFTIISGSQSLPEVKKAMDEASRHYVHLDELMEGVGRRLAGHTKAEWGMASAGCAAAPTHATAASVACANPEKMQRLAGDIGGKVDGANVRCRGNHHYEGTGVGYIFDGVADGDTIRGTVDVGECGRAPFTARRHFHA